MLVLTAGSILVLQESLVVAGFWSLPTPSELDRLIILLAVLFAAVYSPIIEPRFVGGFIVEETLAWLFVFESLVKSN